MLAVGATGYREHVETLVLASPEPIVRRDFVLSPAVVLAVRVLTPAGGLLRDALRERAENASRGGTELDLKR